MCTMKHKHDRLIHARRFHPILTLYIHFFTIFYKFPLFYNPFRFSTIVKKVGHRRGKGLLHNGEMEQPPRVPSTRDLFCAKNALFYPKNPFLMSLMDGEASGVGFNAEFVVVFDERISQLWLHCLAVMNSSCSCSSGGIGRPLHMCVYVIENEEIYRCKCIKNVAYEVLSMLFIECFVFTAMLLRCKMS